jgi:hypothetical protein
MDDLERRVRSLEGELEPKTEKPVKGLPDWLVEAFAENERIFEELRAMPENRDRPIPELHREALDLAEATRARDRK